MTFLVAWESPDGQGFSNVRAESPVDACRQLRYLFPVWGARLRILYVINSTVEEAA